jgi:hypothetical protein
MPFTVDGTHCHFRDPMDPKFFSHKYGKAAINYELAVSIYDNTLIWMRGPYPARKPDIVVFQEGGLKEEIPLGMKCIADNGYHGEKHLISTPNSLDAAGVKELKRRARARHESFNGQLKNF